MRIRDIIGRFLNKTIRPAAGAEDEKLLEWLGITGTPKKVLGEITYFTCLKIGRAHV